MSDSDRLQQLRRQRALAAEQLAWLDQEIAALEAQEKKPAWPPPAEPAPKSAPTIAPTVKQTAASVLSQTSAPSRGPTSLADADALLDEYRVPEDAMKTDLRKGCFLYFFGALAAVALVVAALYFYFRHGK